MVGVKDYPYSPSQYYYNDDFQSLVANTITHPYMSTTTSYGSVPHNIISGTNFGAEEKAGANKWKSEYTKAFVKKSFVEAYHMKAKGLRSEEMMFVG
jgi:hypothetical protein